MKNVIDFYYNINIKRNINVNDRMVLIDSNNQYYFFTRYYGLTKKLEKCLEYEKLFFNNNFFCNRIILNKFGQLYTKINNDYYVLLKVNNNYSDEIILYDLFKEPKFNIENKNYGIELYEIWSKKLDYYEEQIKSFGKNNDILLNSFSYYKGLAELSLSFYFKFIKILKPQNNLDVLCITRKRIFFPNNRLEYDNPLMMTIDYEIRDYSEYFKSYFFYDETNFEELKKFLKIKNFGEYSYHLFMTRLLLPTYYFDEFEQCLFKRNSVEKLLKIISKCNEYEMFLKKSYKEISKYCNVYRIEWLEK